MKNKSDEIAQKFQKLPWWRGATIYQIYPRSYKDTNGDGIGDLKGITEKLEYIASLNVDAVWISPFFTSPMKDFGYDVSNFCDIDPIFGTLNDFDDLIARAHELGLKIIIDQVYSHTSDMHPWFQESRNFADSDKGDYYVWADAKPDGSPPNNWQSVFHGASWTWDARRKQYYLHNFLPEQPDLNLHNPIVQQEILNVAKFWLDRGVDGFRLDALNFMMHDTKLRDNPVRKSKGARTRPFDFQDHTFNMSHKNIPAFLDRLAALINSYDNRFTVAEVGGDNAIAEMKTFIKGDKRINTAYGFVFLYEPHLTPIVIKKALDFWPKSGKNFWPSWAFSNHDAPRALTRWKNEYDDNIIGRTLLALLIALRGNIFLYQGEELGLEQAEIPFEKLVDPEAIANWPLTLGRDGARTPMPWVNDAKNAGFGDGEPWLPIDARHFAKAVNIQENDKNSLLNFTREMIAFRQSSQALLLGDSKILLAKNDILIIERKYKKEKILCVFNLGAQNIVPKLPKNATIIHAINGAAFDDMPPMACLFVRA